MTCKDFFIGGNWFSVTRFPGNCFYVKKLDSSGAFVFVSEFSAPGWKDCVRILEEANA